MKIKHDLWISLLITNINIAWTLINNKYCVNHQHQHKQFLTTDNLQPFLWISLLKGRAPYQHNLYCGNYLFIVNIRMNQDVNFNHFHSNSFKSYQFNSYNIIDKNTYLVDPLL